MLWIIAAGGCLVGILGIGSAVGTRLRVVSLEQELAHWHRIEASAHRAGRTRGEAATGRSELAH